MDTEPIWVGFDLGLRRTNVCVIDDAGETLHEEQCETSLPALRIAISPFPVERIRLISVEAGSETHIVRKLRDAGLPVAMFEARKASKFLAVRRNKTDASDAHGLADLGRVGRASISQVYLKTPECQELRSQLVMRKKLVLLRVAAEGAIRSRLALHGCTFKPRISRRQPRRDIEAQLAELKINEGLDLSGHIAPLLDVCESLQIYIKKLDEELKDYAASDAVCRLLMEVPGMGPICALSFYSAIEDPARFRRSTDVAAYLGLVPRRYQSGDVSRTLGITKTGSKLTRTHLVTAATSFGRHAPDCPLKAWYQALRTRAGSRRARVALARKLSILLLIMWKRGEHFDPSRSGRLAPSAALSDDDTAGRTTI
jgi:transposase